MGMMGWSCCSWSRNVTLEHWGGVRSWWWGCCVAVSHWQIPVVFFVITSLNQLDTSFSVYFVFKQKKTHINIIRLVFYDKLHDLSKLNNPYIISSRKKSNMYTGCPIYLGTKDLVMSTTLYILSTVAVECKVYNTLNNETQSLCMTVL